MRFALSLLALLFGWTALAHDTTNCAYPSSNCSVGNLSLMPNGFISIPNSGTSKQICFDPPVCGNNLMWNSSTSRLMSSANMELQGTVSINGNINLNSSGVLVQQINGLPLTIKGSQADGATSVNIIQDGSNTYATAGAKLVSWRNNTVENASLTFDGYLASITPHRLGSFYINAALAAGATVYGAYILPARAFTAQAVTFRVSTASGGGAGTSVFRVSDGTNNCDFAVNCTATNTGNQNVRQATTAGVCTFAANASLTFSSNASTCTTTQPTILGTAHVEGKWQ